MSDDFPLSIDDMPPELREAANSEQEIDPLACPDCGKVLNTPRGVKAHRTKMHGASSASDSKPRSLNARRTNIERELAQLFGFMGMMVGFADQFDGQVIAANAESMASAWGNLARQNKSVDRVLQGLLTSSSWGGVIMASAAVAIPIMVHHNMVPQSLGLFMGMQPNNMQPEDFNN